MTFADCSSGEPAELVSLDCGDCCTADTVVVEDGTAAIHAVLEFPGHATLQAVTDKEKGYKNIVAT